MIKINKWNKTGTKVPAKDGEIDFIFFKDLNVNDFLEIKRGSEYLPEWYKTLPIFADLNGKEDLTAKRCIPVLDSLTAGYFLVLKNDLHVTYDEKTNTAKITSDRDLGNQEISPHSIKQISTMPIQEDFMNLVFKWNNPYIIKTPENYSILFTHPLNYPYLPFYSLSGVVDTDSYFQPVLFPFLMKKKESFTIPAQTPIIQIIPFKRDDWKYNVFNRTSDHFSHLLQKEMAEYESFRYDSEGKPMGGMYKKLYRKKKKFL